MKMSLKSAIALIAVAAPSFAFATTWELDSSHSSAQFGVKHMMVSTVRGAFSNVKGTINIDDKDITKSTIETTIDATTINTNEPKRDEHLKSPDFFDTAKFPTITFKSTKVAKAGKDKLKVSGDLTMHGVTKPVVLDVDGPTAESKDPWGNVRRGATATTKIKRSDFGLTWNKALETGGFAVGDEVTITLDLEATKKADAAAAPAAKDTK
ncbi:polyisoprenoid-binding protein [Corallococcus praedator]|uniref:Polyisoprenoid-binding protein n=1 Tax=Corallococcus praedator TaxID=2316724 RepID=A0ABX9Q8V9_9BACT|nr:MULTISPECIES: YceI family protein [Corallococcus]RKH12286.1 polyisoprenoid-binding protein [Corallococcus sp. CA047B]RKH22447.1 polyisoprenoid-binding protein [Corallococcus sp. CA031C]RKH95880.1 polyisoprenoid-binding protein [Corallococcus praedator]